MFRLGDMHKPAEIRNTRSKEWRFFECSSQKILLEPCVEKSPYIDIEGEFVQTLILKGFKVSYVQPE